MFDFVDRLRLSSLRHRASEENEALEGKDTIRLLLVSCDDDLYLSVHNAATLCGWEMRLTRSVEQSVRVLDEFKPPLVVYDWASEEDDWRFAVDRLTARPDRPCVLLASRVVDEYLWAEVVRHGGFDVIPRSANSEQLIGSIRFACFSLRRSHLSPAHRSSNIAGGRGSGIRFPHNRL